MRCLMCGKEIAEEGFADLFRKPDVLCHTCRSNWKRIEQRFRFQGKPAYSIYAYEGGFSSCLLQYKECYDEALKSVFLMQDRSQLRRMFHGRTLLLLPSSREKEAERGFSHLRGMFEVLGLPMLEPFEKTDAASQKLRTRSERRSVEHHIRLKNGVQLPRKVVLCDDVITTGATMRGALSALPDGIDARIFACARTVGKAKSRKGLRKELVIGKK